MNEQQAREVLREIERVCNRFGLHWKYTHFNKPVLKAIECTVEIKVDK